MQKFKKHKNFLQPNQNCFKSNRAFNFSILLILFFINLKIFWKNKAVVLIYNMKKILLNISNHPSVKWDNIQKEKAVSDYGEIIDWDFPNISPEWETDQVRKIAIEYAEKVEELQKTDRITVHLMGEFTFTFLLANLLISKGVEVICSTTSRTTIEDGNKKISVFSFVKFRSYQNE